MELLLKIRFYTDGDYYIDNPEKLIDTKYPLYSGAKVEYTCEKDIKVTSYGAAWFVEPYYADLELTLNCKGEKNACFYAARDLLEEVMCNFRTFKYSLIKHMYNLLIPPRENLLFGSTDIEHYDSISGNYEGTEIYLSIKQDKE